MYANIVWFSCAQTSKLLRGLALMGCCLLFLWELWHIDIRYTELIFNSNNLNGISTSEAVWFSFLEWASYNYVPLFPIKQKAKQTPCPKVRRKSQASCYTYLQSQSKQLSWLRNKYQQNFSTSFHSEKCVYVKAQWYTFGCCEFMVSVSTKFFTVKTGSDRFSIPFHNCAL